MADSLFSQRHVNGILIPIGLLVVGTLIVKREWTPYAGVIALTLGALKYYNSRRFPGSPRHADC